jgi:hypothetical protein
MSNGNGSEAKRLPLSPDALKFLEMEVQKFKEKGIHFKLNEGRLASQIIELFCSKYIDKEREWLERRFFDKRSYLKTLIERSGSEIELSNSLSEFVKETTLRKPRGRKRKSEGEVSQ